MTLTATFKARTGSGPVADAQIHFHSGILDGFRLEGFSIWERDGKLFATVPSRSYEKAGKKEYWDILRFDGEGDGKWAVKNWLVAEYQKQAGIEEVPF